MPELDWRPDAARLADDITHSNSRWHRPLSAVPRHVFIPRWWWREDDGGLLAVGADEPEKWMRVAYANMTVCTRLGPLHADHATPDERPQGGPTSSSTLPGLVVSMYRHAMIGDSDEILVTTGTGYGTALACQRLTDHQVTSIDVDPYLVEAATRRLDSIGLHPKTEVCDITGPLPGTYDRIISTVSVPSIPASWLTALRPGGRLVTTFSDTGLIVTADKHQDGGARGQIAYDQAGFMTVRHGDDYAPSTLQTVCEQAMGDAESVTTGRYPVLHAPHAWDVWSMLNLAVPGIEYRRHDDGDTRTVWLLHPDGSWARAQARKLDPPTVHQSGPQRLYDELERVRDRLNYEGGLPVYGSSVRIDPDGTTRLKRGDWTATIPATWA